MSGHAAYRPRPRPVRVWAPVSLLVWLLLVPLAIIAAPLAFAAGLVWRRNPFAAAAALIGLAVALAGVRIDVETPDARVHLF